MKIKNHKIFNQIIKNGKYLLVDPICCVFILKKINYKKNSFSNLIGTLVKKKILKNRFIEIE
ncbi:hypothetical protein [Blattabacterium cuenoti]|uniref:hypothetical protein n=1 Tax=Blattabacterium cuenoti TaxID=1653831 RepID=UPI00163CDFE1|nr:hypothetical protein [Blattabacterium cuenoti]